LRFAGANGFCDYAKRKRDDGTNGNNGTNGKEYY
jgi:hypothetical protein